MGHLDANVLRQTYERLALNHHTRPSVLRTRRLTAPWRPLPDFAVIGAQKCGTTTLFKHLASHPRIVAPLVKETRHFDLGPDRPVSAYRAHFPILRPGDDRITGEGTPEYLYFPHVPEALHRVVPDLKMIVLLRDPVARAFSQWHMSIRKGDEHLDFEAAIDAEPQRLASGPGAPSSAAASRWSRFGYVTRGEYATQLERWFSVFPREQFLILFTEHLAASPAPTWARIFEFLGIEPVAVDTQRRHNAAKYEPVSTATRERLESYYETHDLALAELLGCEVPWRSG